MRQIGAELSKAPLVIETYSLGNHMEIGLTADFEINAVERIDRLAAELRDQIVRETALSVKEIRGSLEGETAKALQQVAYEAIEKSYVTMDRLRLYFVTIGVSTATIFAGFVYQGYDRITSYAERKVDAWVSVDEGRNPIRTTIEELRNRTLLDSYTTRYLRQMEGDPYTARSLPLTQEETVRLLSFMKDPKTSDRDFFDAARVIALSVGPIVFWPDQQISDVVKLVFSSTDFSENKRYSLLLSWAKFRDTLPIAEEILKTEKSPAAYRSQAFSTVASFDQDTARKYAASGLLRNGEDAEELAVFLAQEFPEDKALTQWLTDPKLERPKEFPAILMRIGIALASTKDITPAVINISAETMTHAIQAGAQVCVLDSEVNYRDISACYKQGSTSYYRSIERLRDFLSTQDVISKVIKKSIDDPAQFSTSIAALQVVDDGNNPVAEIRAKMNGGKFVLDDGRVVGSDLTRDPVLVRSSAKDPQKVDVSYRTINGEYLSGTLSHVEKGAEMVFSYSFDKKVVDKLEMRRLDRFSGR